MATKFTRAQRVFLKKEIDKQVEWGQMAANRDRIADEFNKLYPDRVPPMKGASIGKYKSRIDTFIKTGKTFEDFLDHHDQCSPRPFLRKEEAWLKMYTHLREDAVELTKQYKEKFGIERSPEGLMTKIQELNGKGNNLIFPNKQGNVMEDISHRLEKLNSSMIFIDDDLTKGNYGYYALMCKKYGHITMKQPGGFRHGCGTCSNFGRHEDPLEPGIYYVVGLLDSTLNDFKPGITLERVGIAARAKRYGRYEIYNEVHKPIGELEIFEKEMLEKYKSWCTHNPMLYKNGSTECLNKEILPELQKDIKNYESR